MGRCFNLSVEKWDMSVEKWDMLSLRRPVRGPNENFVLLSYCTATVTVLLAAPPCLRYSGRNNPGGMARGKITFA